jgi:hypothetical protein
MNQIKNKLADYFNEMKEKLPNQFYKRQIRRNSNITERNTNSRMQIYKNDPTKSKLHQQTHKFIPKSE